MRRTLVSLLVAGAVQALATAGAWAQQPGTGQVTGTVTGAEGQPLAGASVSIDGTQLGALTGQDGTFLIADVPVGTYRVGTSLLGYAPHALGGVTVTADQATTVEIQLESEAIALEEIVVVGYGEQRKATLTGSATAVSGQEIDRIPTANLSNTVGGKLSGVVTLNTSGEPGYDGSDIRIRGSTTLNDAAPLIVIDGVPDRAGGFERLNAQDIENISVLKDASAAIYGARAANGVILVTTKRGSTGAPQLSATINTGFTQPTRIPEMADAATYMTMLNEIDMYRDQEPRYTEEEIQNHRNETDPWLYPNTDWFDEVLKPVSMQSRADVSLQGGTEGIGYYLSLGALTEDGYYRNSATRYDQYSFRSNIDGHISDALSVNFDLVARLEDRNFPNRSAGDIFRALMRGKPNLPAYWPSGEPGPDIEYGDNPAVIGTPATGYSQDQRYYLQGTLGATLEVPGVTGLTLQGNASYDPLFQRQKDWRTPWTLYSWDYETRDENGNPILEPGERGYDAPELEEETHWENRVLLSLVANYQRDFGPHSIGLMAGGERQTADSSYISAFRKNFVSDQTDQIGTGADAEKENGGAAFVRRRQNYFGRINYDYQDKYLLELVGRYDGSYIFPEDERYGLFPAVSAAWRISEEPFFRDRISLFDELKLRASWGQTGNDRIDEWQYLSSYTFGDGYVFGGQEVQGIFQARTPNPDVTWEVANQLDVGVEATLLENRLSVELDVFRERRTDILHYRNASVPQTAGVSLPRENIGEVEGWGYDGTIAWNQQLSQDVSYDVRLSFGYAQNEIVFWDEPPGAPEWQRSTGARMPQCDIDDEEGEVSCDTNLYYKAIGVFEDEAAVENYPHWGGARPGDIIFEDINEDGVIDGDDRIRINENDEPTFIGGVTLGAQVKNFTFSAFFQGAAGAVQYVATESGDIGNWLKDYADKRWTPDNPNGEHPRTYNREDEYWISNPNTYFLRDTDYIRLKTVEVGYRVPPSFVPNLGMQDLRLFVSGFNVFTLDRFGLMDPEGRNQTGQYYPQQRVFNVGAAVTF